MKLAALLFTLTLSAFADRPTIEVPFPSLNQKVEVTLVQSRCTVGGARAYKLKTVIPGERYELICKLRPPVDKFESHASIRSMKNFKYPDTILEDMRATGYGELKASGEKAIRTKTHDWGTEYEWSTPTKGAVIATYLCPREKRYCFKIIHGGSEELHFEPREVQVSSPLK